MVQLPAVFGFVAPMITYFSLNVTNWYIKADVSDGWARANQAAVAVPPV
jgi:hypothetical protein